MITSDLWIMAVINTVEKGHIDAIWKKRWRRHHLLWKPGDVMTATTITREPQSCLIGISGMNTGGKREGWRLFAFEEGCSHEFHRIFSM